MKISAFLRRILTAGLVLGSVHAQATSNYLEETLKETLSEQVKQNVLSYLDSSDYAPMGKTLKKQIRQDIQNRVDDLTDPEAWLNQELERDAELHKSSIRPLHVKNLVNEIFNEVMGDGALFESYASKLMREINEMTGGKSILDALLAEFESLSSSTENGIVKNKIINVSNLLKTEYEPLPPLNEIDQKTQIEVNQVSQGNTAQIEAAFKHTRELQKQRREKLNKARTQLKGKIRELASKENNLATQIAAYNKKLKEQKANNTAKFITLLAGTALAASADLSADQFIKVEQALYNDLYNGGNGSGLSNLLEENRDFSIPDSPEEWAAHERNSNRDLQKMYAETDAMLNDIIAEGHRQSKTQQQPVSIQGSNDGGVHGMLNDTIDQMGNMLGNQGADEDLQKEIKTRIADHFNEKGLKENYFLTAGYPQLKKNDVDDMQVSTQCMNANSLYIRYFEYLTHPDATRAQIDKTWSQHESAAKLAIEVYKRTKK